MVRAALYVRASLEAAGRAGGDTERKLMCSTRQAAMRAVVRLERPDRGDAVLHLALLCI
jgi:hypothetical protein